MFNFNLWLKGLYAAAIGGAMTSAASAVTDPSVLSHPKQFGMTAAAGAVATGLGYLKTHPPIAVLDENFDAAVDRAKKAETL